MDEVLEVGAPEQYKALAHPLRRRLLLALGRAPATTSQLAVSLGARKGNVGHHLKVLREAGLVRVTETRRVRGGTEQYYQRTAKRLSVPEPAAGHAGAVLGAVGEELLRAAGRPVVLLRHLRLTEEGARELGGTLRRLVDQAEDAGDDEAVHGVLVALCRQA